MDLEELRLGELVCARVCHDVGGLIGTLAGTLELAQEESGDASGEAIALARETADALARRLRLLRIALGPVSEPLNAQAIADLAVGLDARLRVDVSDLGSRILTAQQAQLALAMMLLGAEALPMCGSLDLSIDAERMLRVVASGRNAAWPPSVIQGLAGFPPQGPRNLLAPLCALLARAAGTNIVADEAPPALRMVAFDHTGVGALRSEPVSSAIYTSPDNSRVM